MNGRFELHPVPLEGAFIAERKVIADSRGFLERLFCETDLAELLDGCSLRQINRTMTREKGSVRGMHFQRSPHGELKFIHCLAGRVLDVAVDLRRGSPTFGKWHGVELSGEDHRGYVIPEGFAHGFQTLTDNCEMLYFHTASYNQEAEGGVSPLDPTLAISWPLAVSEISDRDRSHPLITQEFEAL